MFKHDNNHNVSIIPEDEASHRPLQVYKAAFIVHCNIITSGTDINMINRIDCAAISNSITRDFHLAAKLKRANNKSHVIFIINMYFPLRPLMQM